MCLHVHAHLEPVAERGDVADESLPQELPRADGPVGGDADRTVRRTLDDAEAA